MLLKKIGENIYKKSMKILKSDFSYRSKIVNIGRLLEGEKIVLEAGHIDLSRKISRAQGYRGDRAVGKIRVIAFVSKPYSSISMKPTKI